MPGLITGLNIGKRALYAQQAALQVTGNNIANVNTPGYSRQRVNLKTTSPHKTFRGQLGSGVAVEGVRRAQDALTARLLRREIQNLGNFEALAGFLEQIEAIVNEPSDAELNNLMGRVFDAFQDLANNPEKLPARSVLRERGVALTSFINDFYHRLEQLKKDTSTTLKDKTQRVNNITQEIAYLNQQIKKSEGVNVHANELRDRRDALVDQLSQLIDINVLESKDGMLTINTGKNNLIAGMSTNKLEVTTDKNTQVIIKIAGSGMKLNINNGELKGLLDVHNSIIPDYQARLDDLTAGLANAVNELHEKGYSLDGSTGNSFFTFTSDSPYSNTGAAATIAVADAIIEDPNKIAAAANSDAPGDNSIAIAIANLQNIPILNEGTATLNEFYQSMVGNLGAQSQEANRQLETQALIINQLEQRKASISSVSLDEEAINLINFQNAYQAAAQYINVINELLNVVVNKL